MKENTQHVRHCETEHIDDEVHPPCNSLFEYNIREEGFCTRIDNSIQNIIVFMVEGVALASCNGYIDKTFYTGECFTLPKNSYISIKCLTGCKFLKLNFDLPFCIDNHDILRDYFDHSRQLSYNFDSIPIRPPLDSFVQQVAYYLSSGLNTPYIHTIKHYELSFLLKTFYSRDEVVRLLYPLFGNSLRFKDKILVSYTKINNIDELAAICKMSRRNFDRKFKSVFGQAPQQWILDQKSIHVKRYLSDPQATIAGAMEYFGFNSDAHFNRYCKRYFNSTPGYMIRQAQKQYTSNQSLSCPSKKI